MKIPREEIIFRVRGAGCKMLDRLDLETMSRSEIIRHLKKSCCKVYAKLVALYGEDLEITDPDPQGHPGIMDQRISGLPNIFHVA
jgi:hypothetical protein